MIQVHSKVIQLYIHTYIIFEIIFHCKLLQDIDYSFLKQDLLLIILTLVFQAHLCPYPLNFSSLGTWVQWLLKLPTWS